MNPNEERLLRTKANLLDRILSCKNPGEIVRIVREAENVLSAVLGRTEESAASR